MLKPIAVSGSFLLAACAGPATLSERNTEPGNVIVALAVDQTAAPLRAFDLELRSVDRSFATDVPYTIRGVDAARPDFRTNSETGIVLQKRLPPGEYEIVDLMGDRGSFWWAKETRPVQSIAIRFVVAPGGATYLGHFRVGVTDDRGQPALALAVSDQKSADIARARRKYPELEQVAVADARTGGDGALATP